MAKCAEIKALCFGLSGVWRRGPDRVLREIHAQQADHHACLPGNRLWNDYGRARLFVYKRQYDGIGRSG